MVDPMNPGGIFLSLAGVFVLCQVFPGKALQRLNILPTPAEEAGAQTAGGAAKQAGKDAVNGGLDALGHAINPLNWFG